MARSYVILILSLANAIYAGRLPPKSTETPSQCDMVQELKPFDASFVKPGQHLRPTEVRFWPDNDHTKPQLVIRIIQPREPDLDFAGYVDIENKMRGLLFPPEHDTSRTMGKKVLDTIAWMWDSRLVEPQPPSEHEMNIGRLGFTFSQNRKVAFDLRIFSKIRTEFMNDVMTRLWTSIQPNDPNERLQSDWTATFYWSVATERPLSSNYMSGLVIPGIVRDCAYVRYRIPLNGGQIYLDFQISQDAMNTAHEVLEDILISDDTSNIQLSQRLRYSLSFLEKLSSTIRENKHYSKDHEACWRTGETSVGVGFLCARYNTRVSRDVWKAAVQTLHQIVLRWPVHALSYRVFVVHQGSNGSTREDLIEGQFNWIEPLGRSEIPRGTIDNVHENVRAYQEGRIRMWT